jgi:hypothetical protein
MTPLKQTAIARRATPMATRRQGVREALYRRLLEDDRSTLLRSVDGKQLPPIPAAAVERNDVITIFTYCRHTTERFDHP